MAALVAAAALVLAVAAILAVRGGWPGSLVTVLLGIAGLICIAPFAVAFAAGRRREAVAVRDPFPRSAAPSARTAGVRLEATPAVGDVARMALEKERLETELHSTLQELRASRLRILSAADRERRRIERDLHDGAQQRLVALGIQLELAAELVEAEPARVAARLRELARDVDEAVDELRTLARGLVPPTLVERGLVDALRDAAAISPLIARVQASELGRYAPELESAVYFCCLEALQNAAKHAAGARFVTVRLWEQDELHFEVSDDGPGLPDGPRKHGAGLTNMRDRIGAVGGRLRIESARGDGTCVSGTAPLTLLALNSYPRP